MEAAMAAREVDSQAGNGMKSFLHIPSHAEVLERSRPQAPPSFFRPSSSAAPPVEAVGAASVSSSASQQQQSLGRAGGVPGSFGEAFSFVRQTEFYTPPPAAPTPTVPVAPSEGVPGNGVGSRSQEALPTVNSQARNAILVNRRQTGNPVLKYIRNVRWVFGDIVPDYLLGQSTCALYISLRYHLLHPDYLYFRIRELQKGFRLRVVLCHVDLEDVIKPLHEVIKTSLLHDCSLLCAWSLEECARYLETLKTYEHKPADNIQERTDNDYISRMTSALTTVRHVNKTDVLTLGSTFETLTGIFSASMEDLARCPGIGERKVKRLYDAFHEPFRRTTKQLQLDNMLTKVSQSVTAESNTTLDSSTMQIDTVDTAVGASEPNADIPELSVRQALNTAYAKVVERRRGSRTETSMKDMSTDCRHTPLVNVEVIDIT